MCKRADVILAGACLIERIMTFFRAQEMVVSDQGVRYATKIWSPGMHIDLLSVLRSLIVKNCEKRP